MLNKDIALLEEAYLSVSKKMTSVPSDQKNQVSTEPNAVVSSGPVDEPAPGVSMDMINSEVEDVEPEDKDTTGVPVSIVATSGDVEDMGHGCSCGAQECDCEEAHEMAIDNLNSIRESIMKIASHCASGNHLEAWAHQKLAIAMDNLAGIARSLH